MSGIQTAISERWAATAALVALVPAKRCYVGKSPASDEEFSEEEYPQVSRLIQFEQRAIRTSDKKIFRSTVVFRIVTHDYDDGQAVREAFWGAGGVDAARIDGFERASFDTATVRVLQAREEDWSEMQEETGPYVFLMAVEFLWYYLPVPPVIVEPTGDLMYSQTSQVPASAVAETSLVGTGPGSLIVTANSQSLGDKFVVCFSGYYSSDATDPGKVRFAVTWGASQLRTPWIQLLAARDEACFWARFEFTRVTLGAFGQYSANGIAFVEDGSPETQQVRTFGVGSLATDADATFGVKLELDEAGNNFVCGQLDVEKKTVAT